VVVEASRARTPDHHTDVNTIEPILPPSPLRWQPLPTKPRRRWLWWTAPLVVLVMLGAASTLITVPYYTIAPGSARQVNDLIAAPPDHRFPPRGSFLLTTVTLRRATAFEAFAGWLDSDTDVVPEEQILGTTKPRDLRQQNLQLMDDSKQIAVVVALRRLGYPVGEHGDGARLEDITPESPADGRLQRFEIVKAVDGRPTSLSTEVVDAIGRHRPGDVLRVEVDPGGGAPRRVEEVVLGVAPADRSTCARHAPGAPVPDGALACLGVRLQTANRRFDLPFQVNVDSAGIGGPSAGLAFTLGVLDHVTPGELTGGRPVAVTGTIDLDGRVGPVGGVAQKTAAVRAAGVKVFLVPAAEFDAARAHAGRDVRIVKVTTLEDALVALGQQGGDVSALAPVAGGAQG
jgi:PDZ domain-containing protein